MVCVIHSDHSSSIISILVHRAADADLVRILLLRSNPGLHDIQREVLCSDTAAKEEIILRITLILHSIHNTLRHEIGITARACCIRAPVEGVR